MSTITVIWVTATGIQSVTGDLTEQRTVRLENGVNEITLICRDATVLNQTLPGLGQFHGLVALPNGTILGTVKSVSLTEDLRPRLNEAGAIEIGQYGNIAVMTLWTLDDSIAATLAP